MSRAKVYSVPPGVHALKESTRNLTANLDGLDKSVGHLPLPPPTPKAPLNDAQRVEVCRELDVFYLNGGYISLDQAVAAYRLAAITRMGTKP